LGEHDDRLKIQEFENYLSTTFFQGQAVHIVPRSGKDVLYFKIGDDKQYPIYDLGEGIQSIILLTYPLFFNEGKQIIFFIEEPELHLHPGLERIFIETLRSTRFESFQYFITTHSNHILDLTLEYDNISIFSFEKKRVSNEQQFIITNVNSDHKQLLELLGVRNSSVFLSNCTIWVEGITDRLYLRKYIEIIQQNKQMSFKEDYHYSFIEYAGNNITHWSFLESGDAQFANINIEGICSKIFLIADNDGVDLPAKRSREKKLQRQQQLQQKLGDHFYLTKGLEVENMLSKEVIKKLLLKPKANLRVWTLPHLIKLTILNTIWVIT
jgi:predicted ATP-dependent endonuclease of OLD family